MSSSQEIHLPLVNSPSAALGRVEPMIHILVWRAEFYEAG
jgi:hypothetical protein